MSLGSRQPEKKLAPDEEGLLRLPHRWRGEAEETGRNINRIAVAYEAGRDGFWLARWLRAHGLEAHVIHPNRIAVSREHRRAKTDRLDTALLKWAFLGWLRGERDHCSVAAIPSLEEEDAKRPSREREKHVGERTRIGNRIKSTLARLGVRGFKPTLRMAAQRLERLRTPEGEPVPPQTLAELRREIARLRLLAEQIRAIETARLQRLEQPPNSGDHPMVRLLAPGSRSRHRDRRHAHPRGVLTPLTRPPGRGALWRSDGLAGRERSAPPGERAGQGGQRPRAPRHDPVGLALLMFQKDSALAQWYRARTADARGTTRKALIIALARKLLVALWRLVTTGQVPRGVVLRPAA